LGLPISKRLATLLDGSLEMESVLGKGSVFRLVLPREGTIRVVDLDEFSTATAA
jgi:signal transduction histidine kinase